MARAGFADPDVAVEVLRHVQVLTQTSLLATLDYSTPAAPRATLGNLIAAGSDTEGAATQLAPTVTPAPVEQENEPDAQLVRAAEGIVADAEQQGVRLSQSTLAARLRAQGYSIANRRLQWLATTVGLWPQSEPSERSPS